MRYLLDADWAIFALGGREPEASALDRLVTAEGVGISWVTVGEIYEGAFDKPDTQEELAIYRKFLRPLSVLDFNAPIMELFARVRAELRQQGQRIPDIDLLAGVTAVHYDLTVLTYNVRHFGRIPGISIYQKQRG